MRSGEACEENANGETNREPHEGTHVGRSFTCDRTNHKSSSKGDGTAYNGKPESVLAGESGEWLAQKGPAKVRAMARTVAGQRFRRGAALSPEREDVL